MHVAQTRTRKRNQQGGEVPAVSVIRVRGNRHILPDYPPPGKIFDFCVDEAGADGQVEASGACMCAESGGMVVFADSGDAVTRKLNHHVA